MNDDLIQRVGWTLLHTTWQGTAAAVALALALRLTRDAATRHLLAWLALSAVLTASVFTFHQLGAASASSSGAYISFDRSAPWLIKNVAAVADASKPLGPAKQICPLGAVVGTWATGVVALSLWQLIGWLTLQHWKHSARPVDEAWQTRFDSLKARIGVGRVALKLCDHIDVPIVVGLICPAILTPIALLTELPVAQVQAILAHELVHVRRMDYAWNLLLSAIETLLFFHPAIWWIGRQIRRERECVPTRWRPMSSVIASPTPRH